VHLKLLRAERGKMDRPLRQEPTQELGELRSMNVVLPTAEAGEVRLRVVARPEKALARLLPHLGLELPSVPR